MPSSSTVANLSEILKDRFENLGEEQLYKAAPWLALIPKSDNFTGDSTYIPVRYTNEPGGSATFSKALSNRGPSGYKRFELTRRKDYAVASIATELVRASKGNEGAIISAVDSVLRGLQNTQKRSICKALYGNGGGARAQVGSGQGSSTITLKNIKDVVFFEVGMWLDGATTDGTSGSVIAGSTSSKIVSIDRDAGTITNDGGANWNAGAGINGIAANNYLFRQGDFGATLVGLDGWVPSSITGGDSFFGVDRTTDKERLGGCRITGSTAGFEYSTVEGAALALLERVYQAGGSPDHMFLHPQRWRRLVEELGAKRVYQDVKATEMVGFKALVIEGQGGPCKVISDPNCQRDIMWAVTLDTWKLRTLGGLMSVLDDDQKGTWLREGDDDALQCRMATFGNISCDAPGYNGRADLSSIA